MQATLDEGGWHVHGNIYFGDNIEDEWLVTHIIREFTRLKPNTVAWIRDNDGEFLAIEKGFYYVHQVRDE